MHNILTVSMFFFGWRTLNLSKGALGAQYTSSEQSARCKIFSSWVILSKNALEHCWWPIFKQLLASQNFFFKMTWFCKCFDYPKVLIRGNWSLNCFVRNCLFVTIYQNRVWCWTRLVVFAIYNVFEHPFTIKLERSCFLAWASEFNFITGGSVFLRTKFLGSCTTVRGIKNLVDWEVDICVPLWFLPYIRRMLGLRFWWELLGWVGLILTPSCGNDADRTIQRIRRWGSAF